MYNVHVYKIRVTIQTCSFVFVIVFQTENTFHKNINNKTTNLSSYIHVSYIKMFLVILCNVHKRKRGQRFIVYFHVQNNRK